MGNCTNLSYPMINEFSYQGYVTNEDLSNIHKAFKRGHIRVWNAFANEWFTESQQEEWEMGNCIDCKHHCSKKSEEEYFEGTINNYWDKFRKFTEITGTRWGNYKKLKEWCEDDGLYFNINNPFTWSQPFDIHEEWVKEMKKKVWIDDYIRDCYYTYLNPNYPKFMYQILEMYLAESGESPNIYNKEQISTLFRHDCPSTWLSCGLDKPWRFIIDIFGDINDNDENTQMLRHFTMFLLKEGMFRDFWTRLNHLDIWGKRNLLNGDPEDYLNEIISHSRCFDAHRENVAEAEEKLLNLDEKWQKVLNDIINK